METTRSGTWRRDRRVYLRLNDLMLREIAAVTQPPTTISETIVAVLANWIANREIARLTEGSTE